jgi:hypothetical protein
MTILADMWVHAVRERKGRRDIGSGFQVAGLWAVSGAGPKGFPGPFCLLFLFPFLFLFSFKTLVFWLQNDSNKFEIFSKIQNKISRH